MEHHGLLKLTIYEAETFNPRGGASLTAWGADLEELLHDEQNARHQ
jgi:hypothetical protein